MKTVTVTGASCGHPSNELRTKLFAKHLLALGRHRESAGSRDASHPALVEALRTQRCAHRAGEVRPPLAPVKTRPAKDAAAPVFAAPRRERFDIDTKVGEEPDARGCNHTGVGFKLKIVAVDHRCGQCDTEPTSEMVVTGAGGAQRGIARTDRQGSR